MSSGLECDIVGLNDGRWFYMLQSPSCSAGAWDWRDQDPSVGGPFTSEDAAFEALRKKHSNPGGYTTEEMSVEEAISDPVLKENIERALGSELVHPDFPDEPVDVGYVLLPSGHTMISSGIVLMIEKTDDGSVSVKNMSSFGPRAEVLNTGYFSAMRDASGIDATISGSLPDEIMNHMSEVILGRTHVIYAKEMLVIKKDPDAIVTDEPGM
jgi:hypothetical protein